MQEMLSANGPYIPIEEININQVCDLKCCDCYFSGNDVYISFSNLVWEMDRASQGSEPKNKLTS